VTEKEAERCRKRGDTAPFSGAERSREPAWQGTAPAVLRTHHILAYERDRATRSRSSSAPLERRPFRPAPIADGASQPVVAIGAGNDISSGVAPDPSAGSPGDCDP